jgi:hypothetical protein
MNHNGSSLETAVPLHLCFKEAGTRLFWFLKAGLQRDSANHSADTNHHTSSIVGSFVDYRTPVFHVE